MHASAIPTRLMQALAERYALERELGQGGMATVYLAEDLKHHRRVAVKVLRPELAEAVGAERFLREIETTANLRHPHILPLYDSGDADGFLFYVMPFVEGESLRDRLDREKQLPLDDAMQVTLEVADALSYAHNRGVIHRDIKPENILLEGAHAVVADFGIAKAVSVAGQETITQAGVAVGTPAYMSPEQAAGEQSLDGRSDLYSLGCVVYEMLAGQPPFTGPTVESVVHQHLVAEARPITQIRPAVPAGVAAVLQRALAKNPADRFNPVAQFVDAIRPGAFTMEAAASAATRPSAMRWPLMTAAALLVGAVVLGGVALLRRGPDTAASPGIPSVAVLPFVDLSGGPDEYLGDGIAETLIHALSAVEGLRVAARTSTFTFKGRAEDVRAIGAALGVNSVLEGSVQRAGDRLRIRTQLVNAADGFQLWSQSFDRDMSDVFAVQDEVARAVVAALEVRLVGDGSAPVVDNGTESLPAYNAYLQGLFFWNKRSAADLQRAADYFRDAIAEDSTFAHAWAGLAGTYALFGPSEYDIRTFAPAEVLVLAERAALRALALDEHLAEPHAALGLVSVQRGRMDEAGENYRRAIALDPRYPTARQWHATTYLARTGRMSEALEQMQTAEQLDPLSLVIGVEVGELLDAVGRNEAARAQYERVLERYPEVFLTDWFVGLHFLMNGEFERAADLVGRATIGWGADSSEAARVTSGIRDPASRRATLLGIADTSTAPEFAAAAYRALGMDSAAVTGLERVVNGPSFERIYLSHVLSILGPELSALPRTQAAVQRLFARLRERYP
ncbi:MAG TPA: protein kinase [Gemmatimonadaceae bacterium]